MAGCGDRFRGGRVARFDRYIVASLLSLFGFFSLVLVAVYWINQAVGLFDRLIGDGQTALVFLEFSALGLPNLIRMVLPVSAFAAVVYAINRLASESELVVMQATGFSAFRLARPVAIFGVIVALMMLALMHFLVPMSRATLTARTAEINESVTARFLVEGQFLNPAPGVTLFIRGITPEGELRDLFLADRRAGAHDTYTATRAFLVRPEASGAAGPRLVMVDGMIQGLGPSGRLTVTRFADFTYDLSGLIAADAVSRRRMEELSTPQLLAADPALLEETRESAAAFAFEAQNRFAQPFLALAAALLGFAALMQGGYSRFGLVRQIGVAVGLIILVQGINTATTAYAQDRDGAALLAWTAPVLGILIAILLLWFSQRPRRVHGARRALA